jgi:hypothetical protein
VERNCGDHRTAVDPDRRVPVSYTHRGAVEPPSDEALAVRAERHVRGHLTRSVDWLADRLFSGLNTTWLTGLASAVSSAPYGAPVLTSHTKTAASEAAASHPG